MPPRSLRDQLPTAVDQIARRGAAVAATKANASAVGVDANAANLGAFTSPLIDDNTTAKAAMESIGTNLAAASGVDFVGGAGAIVATRSALAAFASVGNKARPVLLNEGARRGWFRWDSSNLSAMVTLDTAQGVYVPPASDTTGASGAWVRVYEGPVLPEWFGALGDGSTNDTAAIQAAIDFQAGQTGLQSAGGTVYFTPSKTYLTRKLIAKNSVTLKGGDTGPGFFGVATGCAMLKAFDALTTGSFMIEQNAGNLDDFSIVNLNMLPHTTGASTDYGGVKLEETRWLKMKNVKVSDFGIQAVVIDGIRSYFVDCFFTGLFNPAATSGDVGGAELRGVDHSWSHCELSAQQTTSVVDATGFRIAGFLCDADLSFLNFLVVELGDCGQKIFGRNNVYTSCRWDTNAGHGIYGSGGDTNTFNTPFFNRNSLAADNAYDDIHLPASGMARSKFLYPNFATGTKTVSPFGAASQRHRIFDNRSDDGFGNQYIGPFGANPTSAFYNVSEGCGTVIINGPARTVLSGTTPSVLNVGGLVQMNNGSATSVTNFTGGVPGQEFLVLGDGNSTLTGANFVGGASGLLLAFGTFYRLRNLFGAWYRV